MKNKDVVGMTLAEFQYQCCSIILRQIADMPEFLEHRCQMETYQGGFYISVLRDGMTFTVSFVNGSLEFDAKPAFFKSKHLSYYAYGKTDDHEAIVETFKKDVRSVLETMADGKTTGSGFVWPVRSLIKTK